MQTIRKYIKCIFYLLGVCLLLYPILSNWCNKNQSSLSRVEYDSSINNMSEEGILELKHEISVYNDNLLGTIGSYDWDENDYESYYNIMSMTDDGIMGFIIIPSIGVDLPIYHGTDILAISNGAGHLEGSSLPVGGEGTHTVLTSHSGSVDAVLFSNLNKLKNGDIIIIDSLGESKEYAVEHIWIVSPNDFSHLYIDSNKDICTLVTCDPPGINSNRLLVQGVRVG